MRAEATAESFTDFVRTVESRLRHALIARYGPEVGREAAAEALAFGWEHWARIEEMDNPVGYLYRVGQSKARRLRRPSPRFPAPPAAHEPVVEPALTEALSRLTPKQRTSVVLIHCYEWTMTEVSEALGVSLTTIQKHVERGLDKLRAALEVSTDA